MTLAQSPNTRQRKIGPLEQGPPQETPENLNAGRVHLARCGYSGDVLTIPLEIHNRVRKRDPSFRCRQFPGFYISPGFFYYRTQDDFNMFTES